MIERTFVMLKPDAIQRGLIGTIISRLEARGFKPVAMKFMRIPRELAERHYAEHKGKSFFPGLIDYITSGPVLCMVWEGENIITALRTMMGKTNPQDAAPGTIRGDFAQQTGRNLIHGSDSPESAKREIALFFNDYELQDYKRTIDPWVYE
ncbi:MAG: nucleoside-diphosphate kinase [Methanomassiliicoccales archaeon]|jgi:nucleoside-diphosphate kinase|nr:nucleoside-diphosphate kinase [Methanomassiliicoccales archaeon]